VVVAQKGFERIELSLRTFEAGSGTMPAMLQALDHVTLRSTDLDRTLAFFQSLLGLQPGPRPGFAVSGLWLYANGHPVVHVVERPVEGRVGVIEHVAFQARRRAAVSAQLEGAGVPFELVALPDGSALQMFLHDPDGARIELIFKHPEDR
jgi:catechol 2,3-dioxygenase-like lactoylglutathione lyase family enzyme